MASGQHPVLWLIGFSFILYRGSLAADGPSYSYKVQHSKDGVPHHGVLTVGSSGVGYSEAEDQSDDFHFSCGDFLKGVSLHKDGLGSFLWVPARWSDRRLRSDDEELLTGNLFALVDSVCRNPEVPRRLANLGEFNVRVQGHPGSGVLRAGRLGVAPGGGPRSWVSYTGNKTANFSLDLNCGEFLMVTRIRAKSLDFGVSVVFYPTEQGLSPAAIYQAIRDACAIQRTEMIRLAAQRLDEEARRQQEGAAEQEAATAKRKADFRQGILAALRAAEQADPFSNIRFDFDLTATDSRQWKTGLQLPNAERCALIKTPPPTPTSPSAWTYACLFLSFDGGYEGMVKSVQSVLNLPFQPDEKAVNINQVFFADPAKPTSRVFVAKLNAATVGVSVVAVRLAGGSAAVTKTEPFPDVPTMLPMVGTLPSAEPTVGDELAEIYSKPHGQMPTAQRVVGAPAVLGQTTMTVKNSTAYELSVYFDGPVSQKLTLAPGSSQDLDLAPGTFRVGGRVAAAHVLPFYGEETYAGSARYSVEFYIASQAR